MSMENVILFISVVFLVAAEILLVFLLKRKVKKLLEG